MSRRWTPWRAIACLVVGLVVIGIVVVVVLAHRGSPRPVPSLFALDGEQAQRLLEGEGFEVHLEPQGSCDPGGLVVGSTPPSRARATSGDTVRVRTSIVSGSDCEDTFPLRVLAWQFLRFVLDLGDSPRFAQNLAVYVDGQVSVDRWGDLATAIGQETSVAQRTESGLPVLIVQHVLPKRTSCGVSRPTGEHGRSAVRLQLTDSDLDVDPCPLTIDLYRDDEGRIATVAAYSPRS